MERDRDRAARDDETRAMAVAAIDEFADSGERATAFDRVRVIEDEERCVRAFSRCERIGKSAADIFRRAETCGVDGVERRHIESERSQTRIEMRREDGEIRIGMIEAIPKFRTCPRLEQTSREHRLSVTRTGADRDDADARFESALELRALEPCGKRRRRCELQPMDEHAPDFLLWGGPFPESVGPPRKARVVHEVSSPQLGA